LSFPRKRESRSPRKHVDSRFRIVRRTRRTLGNDNECPALCPLFSESSMIFSRAFLHPREASDYTVEFPLSNAPSAV
jgi:hypothetical protein